MEIVLKKSERKYTISNVKSWYIFLFCIFILLVPIILNGFSLNGYESYLYLRLSNVVGENYDPLSYGGRAFTYGYGNPILLNLLSFLPLNIVLVLLPVVFGVLSLILFYYVLKKLKVEEDWIKGTSLILILSPPFLYSFTSFNYFTVPIFLILLSFYLFIKDKVRMYILSLFISLLLVFFGAFNAIILLLVLFLYCSRIKKFKWFLLFLFSSLLLTSILNYPLITNYGLPNKIGLRESFFEDIIFDLGGGYGISLFLIFLIYFGVSKLWEEKYKHIMVYLIFILSLILLLFSLKTIIYFNFILCFLASLGFLKILKKKWESDYVRNLTFLFLVCGLLFSGVSFFNENAKIGPSENMIDALNYLKNNSNENEVILSYYRNGFWINTIAERKNVVDASFDYAPNADEIVKDVDSLFYTRSMDKALKIFQKYNINYILISEDMKNGLVWNRDNDGLLFLLKYNPDYFNQIYNKKNFEIWRINY